MSSIINNNPDYYKYYETVDELKKYEPELYDSLNKSLKIEDHACFYVYDSPKIYAEYSIKEGYYAVDFSTSPIDLTQFIDYDKLINYLLKTLAEEAPYHDEKTDKIVEVLN